MPLPEKAFRVILNNEGGVSDRKSDRGGLTNMGITHKTLAEWRKYHPDYPVDVRDLTVPQVRFMYERQYWIPSGCDFMPFPIGVLVFDFSVNSGIANGVGKLQRTINSFILDAVPARGKAIKEDGGFGPVTKQALETVLGGVGVKQFGLRYLDMRRTFVRAIVANDKTGLQVRNLKGWLNRIARMEGFLLAENPS